MPFTTCDIPGLVIIEPQIFEDDRGYFFEAYNEKRFIEAGVTCDFIQDNQSKSSYGVIRGLHYQLNPFAQSKLVRVLEGSIIDVAVDVRKSSPTFGKQFSIELSASNKKQLFIPHGFAHGFSVLSEIAIVLYKCDQYYNKQSEAGIRFNDETLAIDWGIPASEALISEKDAILPSFQECIINFEY
jgi:dTDP-4-dehydrorhamnose 3,5-epimerase